MNVDTIKQQLTIARGAYSMGTVNREQLDAALDIIEKEVGATERDKDEVKRKPFGNTEPQTPAPAASNTPSSPQPSTKPIAESFSKK